MEYVSEIRFNTKLAKVLHDEGINQTELFDEMERIERIKGQSPVSKCTISRLSSGKQENVLIETWRKIQRAINSISKKEYELTELMK
jgi:hypothetical protein